MRHDEQVILEECGSKIVLIVEYPFLNEPKAVEEEDTSSSDDDEEATQARKAYNEQKPGHSCKSHYSRTC